MIQIMNKIYFIVFFIIGSLAKLHGQGLTNVTVLDSLGSRYNLTMTYEESGNSYFTMLDGLSDSTFVQKRDSMGNLVWQREWVSGFTPIKVVTDSFGNVYIVGVTYNYFDMDPGVGVSNSNVLDAIAMICLDTSGNFIWGQTTQEIVGSSGNCSVYDVSASVNGGIVIYGTWSGDVDLDPSVSIIQPQQLLNSWNPHAFLLQLDNNGNTVSFNSIETGFGERYEVKGAPNGNFAAVFNAADTLIIFSQGTYFHSTYTSSNQNYCVVEFDQNGGLFWRTDLYNTGFSSRHTICYDQFSNLYIYGTSYLSDLDPGPGIDTTSQIIGGNLFVIKLDSVRNREWLKLVNSGFYYNGDISISVNSNSEIFLFGTGSNNGLHRQSGNIDPLYSPVYSPILINIQPPGPSYTYLVKLNTCAEKEWERFWTDFGWDASSIFTEFQGSSSEIINICGIADNISDLDPDTNNLLNISSPVNQSIFWLQLNKSEYCAPTSYLGTDFGSGTYLTTVLLDTLQDFTAGYFGVNSYNEITGYSTTLYPNESYHLRIITGPDSSASTAAWIDYNNDLSFDSTELLGIYTSTIPFDTVDFYFTVPSGAQIGNARLRVRNICCETGIDPCCNYSSGQTNDYTITIGEGVLDLSSRRFRIPASNFCADTLLPEVKFQNTGNLLISTFTADLEINGVIVSSITSNLFLYEQDSVFLQFPSYYFSPGTSYTLRVIITSVNGIADENNSNDTLLKNVQVFNMPTGTITGDTLLCPGEDVFLTANYSIGITYQWNNGSTIDVFEIIQPDPGPYTAIVVVTDTNGCVVTDSIHLMVFNSINGTIEGDTLICEDDTLSLFANYPLGASWMWQPGSVSDDTLIIAGLLQGSATYSLTVLDSNNCSYLDSATINVVPIAPFNVITPSLVCENDTIVFQLQSSPGSGVVWCDGSTDTVLILQAIQPSVNTCYTLTDTNGCSVSDSINLPVFATPPVPVIQVSYQGPATYLIAPVTGVNITYTWYENGNIVQTGISDTLINPNLSTTYFVVATNADGCNSTSATLLFTGLETMTVNGPTFTVYPNPFQDEIIVNVSSAIKKAAAIARVVDITGRIALPDINVGGDSIRIDTSKLSDGMYLLVIYGDEYTSVARIVKGN
jgi:hypothetical protein